ncbi:hypothetical protein CAFE_11280 [Caprobacter fermentans]|uniref:Uncharacterized protein n=1 Tax=Caproicibacter fermentans TaxID=2576756 RepID=A0A6N8HXM3_9FIRM|nr:hypothetical protein [Caproicibacter fermentans]MVB10439.1 hypothetical protein [Caproicibacter fermentans]
MRITEYEVKVDGQHIGSTPIDEQAVNAAKAYAAEKGTDVSVTAFIDDGRTREINVHPDGTIDRLWEKSGTTITPGSTYTNHNGSDYLCKSIPDDNSAEMVRIKDGWTLVAHGIQKYADGTIEWDYSTGGHWVKTSLEAKLQTAKQEMKAAGPKQHSRVRQAERG